MLDKKSEQIIQVIQKDIDEIKKDIQMKDQVLKKKLEELSELQGTIKQVTVNENISKDMILKINFALASKVEINSSNSEN